MTGVITWAVRVITATATIGCGLWAAIAIRERFGGASRDMNQAIANVCKPCNGEAGLCTCAGKCGNWLCGADDTGISNEQFSRELAEWLRGDGRG